MPRINSTLVALDQAKLTKASIRTLIDNPLKQHIFDGYDPDQVRYVDDHDHEVARGLAALQAYMDAHPANKVFLGGHPKLFDLALEGGGAFGFAHMGTLHAMAMRGIWFDRVSGTSAGSIAATLVAGGYQVDLNYKTIVDTDIGGPLTPHRNNSLNQILFDDQFREFTLTDAEQNIADVRRMIKREDSITSRFIRDTIRSSFDKYLTMDAIRREIKVTEQQIRQAYFNIEHTIIDSVMNFPLVNGLTIGDIGVPFTVVNIRNTVNASTSLLDLIRNTLGQSTENLVDALLQGVGPIYDAFESAVREVTQNIVDVIADAIVATLIIDGNELNHTPYGIYRLIELGGFWEGNFVRDWIETHLQQRNTGSGVLLDGKNGKPPILNFNGAPGRAIVFKDLKIDLCIVAADMGPVDSGAPRTPTPIFFSKATTPNYPVAEAVRRSISLPFFFVPRRLDDGYGNNPPNINRLLTRDKLAGGKKSVFPIPTGFQNLPQFTVAYDNKSHHDNLIFDGGLFFNLPVAVFRDPSDFVFEKKQESKPLIISNINANEVASTCPDDVPRNVYPEPIASIKKTVEQISSLIGKLFGITTATPTTYLGPVKAIRAFEFTMSYMLTEHQETELDSLMRLVPNSLFVDIPLRDPDTVAGSAQEYASEGRIDSGNFAMGKTTKKWIVKNGFDGAKVALQEFEAEVPALRNKLRLPDDLDPYNHLLTIENIRLRNGGATQTVVRAKIGDTCYLGSNLKIASNSSLRLGSQSQKGYAALGDHWIKIENSAQNRDDTSADFLSFEINIRSRVIIALDSVPEFATAANGWEISDLNLLVSNSVAPNPNIIEQIFSLKTFSKLFEKGQVTIPGPKNRALIRNQFAYLILVRPV